MVFCEESLGIRGGGGGKTYRAILGGEGQRTIKCPSKTSFGGLRKWDLSGLCPFPPRKMTGREQRRGGGKRIISGGVQNVSGEGFYGMFSPPLSFPPFLFFSERSAVSAISCRFPGEGVNLRGNAQFSVNLCFGLSLSPWVLLRFLIFLSLLFGIPC